VEVHDDKYLLWVRIALLVRQKLFPKCSAYSIPSGGGLFEFIPNYDERDHPRSGWWLAYQFFFFFFVSIITLNVLLATIVDTFGDLREKAKEAQDELGNSCLICSLDRDAFQQKSKGISLLFFLTIYFAYLI